MRALTLICVVLAFTCDGASLAVFAQSTPATSTPSLAQAPTASQTAPIPPPVDYAGAVWVPAAQGNFMPANRPEGQPIEMVIVHDIEGPDTEALNIFQRAGAKVSSHYVVGVDGTIYQMVREHDVAWHAGNSDINQRSIGIETHGYAYRPGFFSSTIYEAEAKLVRDITQRYNIPRDRTHIIGHAEVPNPRDPARFGGISGHTDPGPYWVWNSFMTLVRNDARVESAQIPTLIRPGEKLPVEVSLQNTGDDVWVANKAQDPRVGLQADSPVIFLGTSQGAPSALSSLSGWMAPQYADVLKGADVPPGSSARFQFTLLGPRTLGEIQEELRATRVPTAAQGGLPVAFGASVPLKLSVVPWDITIPDPDATSTASLVAPAPTSNDSLTTSSLTSVSPPVARWTVRLPIGGLWGVFVAPPKPAKVRKKEIFAYRLAGAEGERDVEVDSKSAGRGLVFGGYYRFPEPTKDTPTITVTLDRAPGGITAANAGSLRFVGPFPGEPGKIPDFQGTTTQNTLAMPQQ